MKFSKHINLFFTEFSEYVKQFGDNFQSDALWLPIIITLLAIFLLSIIISKFSFVAKKTTKSFSVSKSIFISSMLSVLVWISIGCYSWANDFKGIIDVSYRFGILLSVIISFLIAIVILSRLRIVFTRHKLKHLTIQPITEISEFNKYLFLKKAFDKIKYWLIIPALGFLFLGFYQIQYNLISIVIDSSGSMGGGELDKGKEALINTLEQLDFISTDFVISVSPHENEKECPGYTDFRQLLKIRNPDKLCSYTVLFTNESPVEFIRNLDADGNEYIFYAIWQNYLISEQLVADNLKAYDNKVSIIISDFRDADENYFNADICDEAYGFDGFYNGNCFLIDLKEGTPEKFVSEFKKCYPDNVYNGHNIDDYSFALEDIFKDLKGKTYYFIIWLATFYVICSFIIIFINPKKLLDI